MPWFLLLLLLLLPPVANAAAAAAAVPFAGGHHVLQYGYLYFWATCICITVAFVALLKKWGMFTS